MTYSMCGCVLTLCVSGCASVCVCVCKCGCVNHVSPFLEDSSAVKRWWWPECKEQNSQTGHCDILRCAGGREWPENIRMNIRMNCRFWIDPFPARRNNWHVTERVRDTLCAAESTPQGAHTQHQVALSEALTSNRGHQAEETSHPKSCIQNASLFSTYCTTFDQSPMSSVQCTTLCIALHT